jgi:hypothetical protein
MSYLPDLSEEQIAQPERCACRPAGTIDLWSCCPGVHDVSLFRGIFEAVAERHVTCIDCMDGRALRAFHASPEAETRVAEVDSARFAPDEIRYFAVAWTPEMARLPVGDESKTEGPIHARSRNAGLRPQRRSYRTQCWGRPRGDAHAR